MAFLLNQNTPNLDNFKFTGKENLPETGYTDFGARWYDNIVPRFISIDPLAEISKRWSPYAYTYDNPLRFIDPDGMGVRNVYGINTYDGYVGDDGNGNYQGTVPKAKGVNLSKITNIKNVLSGKEFKDFYDNKKWIFFHKQCAEHSREQVKEGNNGDSFTPAQAKLRINMYEDKKRQQELQSPVDIQKGVDLIIDNLKKGRAVMAGVMYNSQKNTGNANAATNHFITIVGAGIDDTHRPYFSYYDNYGGDDSITPAIRKAIGTNLNENRFYYDSNANQFVDSKTVLGKYVMTEVRPNIDDE
ncbi:RHS repeat-associated core domain-containing protein [Flectobacillus major]|uniref:RHS repeat-associated core domain-containing protein n=1 Tax=Flectobacillus major TaxID=103 RepID=UPI001C54E87A|nr:RHS repeat-associated core domain-containing protein [Flectobacillus major]